MDRLSLKDKRLIKDEEREIIKAIKIFSKLSPSEKIRYVLKQIEISRYLKSLRIKN